MRTRAISTLVCGLLAGCGGSETSSSGALPGCVTATESAAARAALPDGMPLPDGTVIEKQTKTAGGTLLVEGYTPGALDDVVRFFRDRLPDAGYELGESEAEEHDAEQRFTGDGTDGFLKLRTIGDCTGALSLGIALTER
jgi:hypothetical protein